MSKITEIEVRGMMEAYAQVYAPQEEEIYIDSLSQEIFEDVAVALISQGYTAIDVLEYFANVDDEVIIEDVIALSEGTLIIESVVSEEYIQEQLEILNEAIPLLGLAARGAMALARPAAGLIAKAAPKVAQAATKLGQKAANVVWKGGSKATPMGRFPAGTATAPGTKLIGNKNIAQKAVGKVKDFAKSALDKLPGGSQGKLASGLKTAGKWALGGAAFEAGARGVKALMGDKGPSPKTAPSAPKAGMVDTAKGQRYKSSSDGKHYANYNDALAARNSRRGVTPSAKAAPAPSAPAAPAKPAAATPAPAKPSTPAAPVKPPTGTAEKPKRQSIAQDVEDIKQMQQRSRQRQGVEMGGPEGPGKIDTKSVEADLKAAQEREKKAPKTTTPQMVKASYEYDAFDIVLEYLLDNGHADTITEAAYIMTEMDAETIGTIVEAKRKSYSAKKARKGEDIGLPGRGFEKIAKEAGKRYGSKERGEKVAGAVLAGLRAKYSK